MAVQAKIVYINYSIHYMEIKNSGHFSKIIPFRNKVGNNANYNSELERQGGVRVKPRKAEYGDKNICGANIERIRKQLGMKQVTLVSRMQLMGVDINPSSLSKLEGQTRIATDIELKAIAAILGVTLEELVKTHDEP